MAAPNSPSASDIPTLLRFLTQEAKLPLSKAMSSVKQLQTASLASPSAIATSTLETLSTSIFTTEDAKRVLNAAKRATKRASGIAPTSPGAARGKKRKLSPTGDSPTPRELEESLSLPDAILDVDVLRETTLYTNRAPLLLAFAVTLLKYTLPNQPLSSRLSLAQGMVSAGAREKAVNLGLEKGKSADEEGFGVGQPVVRIMSREIRVLKRWGYELDDHGEASSKEPQQEERNNDDFADTKDSKVQGSSSGPDVEPALWALDLEALKKSNSSTATIPARAQIGLGAGLPIYTPQSARSYILKSFAPARPGDVISGTKSSKGRKEVEEKERNLGSLLGALELLYQSWAETLSKEELNKRAWSWYVIARPDVEQGVAGWGGKGEVKLARILDLRKR